MDMLLDVRAFGAKGDGISDDTDAVQQAIDEGARSGRAVYISPGRYSVGELVLHPGSTLCAQPQWAFIIIQSARQYSYSALTISAVS